MWFGSIVLGIPVCICASYQENVFRYVAVSRKEMKGGFRDIFLPLCLDSTIPMINANFVLRLNATW